MPRSVVRRMKRTKKRSQRVRSTKKRRSQGVRSTKKRTKRIRNKKHVSKRRNKNKYSYKGDKGDKGDKGGLFGLERLFSVKCDTDVTETRLQIKEKLKGAYSEYLEYIKDFSKYIKENYLDTVNAMEPSKTRWKVKKYTRELSSLIVSSSSSSTNTAPLHILEVDNKNLFKKLGNLLKNETEISEEFKTDFETIKTEILESVNHDRDIIFGIIDYMLKALELALKAQYDFEVKKKLNGIKKKVTNFKDQYEVNELKRLFKCFLNHMNIAVEE